MVRRCKPCSGRWTLLARENPQQITLLNCYAGQAEAGPEGAVIGRQGA